ncbi:MAG: hypothetical protein WCL71_06140 [Deltaproteobacteria bacterium]
MNSTRKLILSIALIFLALIFLFPARRYPEGSFDSGSGAAPRAFLFSRSIYFGWAAYEVTPSTGGINKTPGFWTCLDPTRTTLEAFSIISIGGIFLVRTSKNEES